MKKKAGQTKMGRPPLPPGERRRPSMGFRPTPEVRKRLESAAAANGRSMSQEIETRLEQSFIVDFDSVSESTRMLIRALALANEMAEMTTGKDAFKDHQTAEAALTAMIAILKAVLPVGPTTDRDKIEPSEGQDMILEDPESRSLGDNIRDAILLGIGPNLSAIKKSFKPK